MSYGLRAQTTRLGIAAVVVLSLTPLAEASVISYDFTVTVTSAPLNGDVVNGAFSYDSSSIIPGGENNATGLLTALNFTFNGIAYNNSTVNTGSLQFDTAGNLIGEIIGNGCGPGGCGVGNGNPNQWDIVGPVFNYAFPGAPGLIQGDVTYARVSAIPEPGSLALFAAALLSLGFLRQFRSRAVC
jgi:hypothetical protein